MTIVFDAHDDKSYNGIESDFTTIIRIRNYSIHIIHAYAGVGITDKYKHVTYISVFDMHDCINTLLKDKLEIEIDNGLLKADSRTLFNIMEFLDA